MNIPDTNPSSEISTTKASLDRQLAKQEQQAARKILLKNSQIPLLLAVLLSWAMLGVDFISSTPAYTVLIFGEQESANSIKSVEYIFVILGFIGAGILTPLVLLTRRTMLAIIAWMVSTLAAFFSLFALWLRLTRPDSEAANSVETGYILLIAAVIICAITYSLVTLRRSPEQLELREKRQAIAAEEVDSIAALQAETLTSRNQNRAETNPLLVDDRRKKALQRARKTTNAAPLQDPPHQE
ncbi:hypothetical protein [Corynebacterium caspium]|uniref:Rv2732c family membrane protein n=1 Tax=Corynebacterium caspium TaxID=234828 RepID=UPI00037EBA7C|nr:hypothetical protein [Corynebacterium caspium]WKD59116.1 hypothetical protein CCASP_03560 [Corynebacterium caspium DSM 44850]